MKDKKFIPNHTNMPDQPILPPYIEYIIRRGKLSIWIVDGTYIRTHIDEEFSNFGQHYRFPYIPELELWLDHEAHPDERMFFIDHLLVEYSHMKQGATYSEAITAGDRIEQAERAKAGDIKKFLGENPIPHLKNAHKKLWKTLKNGVEVWLVQGRMVRSVFNIDFTAGGHHYVYEFVPEGEVWVDDDISEDERPYVVLHELHERNRMHEGWYYEKAHAESSEIEWDTRHHPEYLHEHLIAEGWE